MTLLVQIQSMIVSFVFGLVYGFSYGLYNRCVLKINLFFVRIILESLYNCLFVICYFYAMLYVNYGKFYIYHFMLLGLGVLYYLLFLSKGYLRFIEIIFHYLILPFDFIIKKIHGILSHIKRVRGHGNKKKKSQ